MGLYALVIPCLCTPTMLSENCSSTFLFFHGFLPLVLLTFLTTNATDGLCLSQFYQQLLERHWILTWAMLPLSSSLLHLPLWFVIILSPSNIVIDLFFLFYSKEVFFLLFNCFSVLFLQCKSAAPIFLLIFAFAFKWVFCFTLPSLIPLIMCGFFLISVS